MMMRRVVVSMLPSLGATRFMFPTGAERAGVLVQREPIAERTLA
jgi:hypothetical protein